MTSIRSIYCAPLLATLLVVGGSGSLSTALHPSTVAAAPNTLVVGLVGEPDTLNPLITTFGNGANGNPTDTAIYDSLLYVDPHGALQPDLATSVTHSPDGRTWTFHLRKGVKWADGQPFTSADVAYNYRALFDKKHNVNSTIGWDQIDSYSTPDPYTFVCRLKAAYAPFLVNVGLDLLIPMHIFSRPGVDFNKTSFNRTPIGTGPYMVTEWKAGDHITLTANPYSWRGHPYFHTVILKVAPDYNTELVQMRTGEIDAGTIIGSQRAAALAIPGKRVDAWQSNSYKRVDLPQWGFLREQVVRQALDYGTPKQAIFKGIDKGLGAIAYSNVSPNLTAYYDPHVPTHPFNLRKAAAMLTGDGFVKGQDGILQKQGQPFAITLWAATSDTNGQLIIQILQEEWEQLGIKVTLRSISSDGLFGADGPIFSKAMNGLAYTNTNGPDPDDSIQWIATALPKSPTDTTCCNTLGYFHLFSFQSQLDALYRAGNGTVDSVKRRAIYFQIQEMLANQVPIIFLYWGRNEYVVPTNLKGFEANPFNSPLSAMGYWRRG
jgi:peptide/nickel transport system substrate-binding protein